MTRSSARTAPASPRSSSSSSPDDALIDAREPFVAETVFSHPCELDLIDLIGLVRAAGFSVALQVLLTPEDRAVHRVAHLDLDEETTRRYA